MYISQFKSYNEESNMKHIFYGILYKIAISDFPFFLIHHEDIDYWNNLCTSPPFNQPHFCPPLGKMCSISFNLRDATMNQRWACSLTNALRKGYFRFPNIWIDHEYINNRRNLWTYPPFRRFLVVRKWRGGLIGNAGIFEVHERSGLNNW